MRGILALALLAPLAMAAQPEVVDWVRVDIAPFETPVRPLQGAATTPVTTRVSCLLASGAPPVVVVSYAVAESPPWASTLVSPASDLRSAEQCVEGYVAFEATLLVTANDQAPAFAPAPIVVEATAGADQRQQVDRGSVDLSAAYLAIFDAQVEEAQAVVSPGEAHDFHVKVTNFGNGPTRVETTLLQASEGFEVALPAPVTLASRQQGGGDVSADLVFRVRSAAQGGFVNEVGTVGVRVVGSYATDPAMGSDETSIAFLLTVRTGGGGSREMPFPAAGALAALALGATLLPSRRA